MLATLVRLVRTGRLRIAVLSASMAAWFLLIMAVVAGMAEDIEAKTQLFGGALMEGFGIGAIASPDMLVQQMAGVSFNHPVVLALVGGVTVAPAVRACQGELLDGTLDVTLAGPVSRLRYLGGYAVSIVLATATLMVVTWASMIGFERLLGVPGTIDAGAAAMTCLNAFAVFLTFGAIALLVSVLLGRVGNAMFVTIGVLVVMFAITFAERIWSAGWIQLIGPMSVFHWFDPGATLGSRDVRVRDVLVPLAEAVACFALAAWRFERRDL